MSSEGRAWSPYLAGAATGVVLVLSYVVSGELFGTSTSFVRTAGGIEKALMPGHFSAVKYFSQVVPRIDWQWMFVVGIALGSFISAKASGSFRIKAIPGMWEGRFGRGVGLRASVAFIGGTIAMYGARLAGG